ncbi:C-C motif chemokine 19a.2 isoform X2 [Megalobrama amblycephala]|uniref:C-C motif chemokine 19a.2 isoform X2 n=1 Tax=Megalobrama amblycephala TaxID=75352 RepID=UPI002013F842|nr:C-C motif chemokine 19a.2 isoform X2 [Megalobrama amblycephala]
MHLQQPNTKTRMQTSTVTLLVITAVLWGNIEAFSDAAVDCCLTTKDTRIPIQIVASYFHQTTDSGCAIAATVFITKKDKKLCAPPEKNTWINKIISHLEKKKKAPQ